MKIIFNDDNFTLYLTKAITLELENIKENIKKTLMKIKKRYKKNISGFYKVKIYINKKYGSILEFIKEDDLELFKDIIDLKLTINEKAPIYLEIEDPLQINNLKKIYILNNKYYVDIDKLTKKELYKLIEFSKIIYGETLENIKQNVKELIKQ